jgi:alanine dehydrogenase
MLVGIPREVKNHEYRVAITPAGVRELTARGHDVLLERDAGAGAGLPDDDYVAAGARIAGNADEVWGAAGLVLKVKEPVPEEYHRLRADQVLFTYLHLAASKECTDALVTAGATAVAYETVRLPDGSLPLLAPMSEVAGRMAPQVGAHHLQRTAGGRGVLLGGVSGVPAGKVAVLGAGVSGMNAATIALGLQAEVVVLDTNINRLRQIDFTYRGHLQTIMSNAYEVERACLWADLVIGAVLVPGAKAPTLVPSDLVAAMRPGSVLVDIAIDQGGCFADSRPTTHDDPVFRRHGSIFYCVANMPGAVPNTSTRALTNVTLPYVLAIADRGLAAAVADDPALAEGVNVAAGRVVQPEVAAAHGQPAVPLRDLLGSLPSAR